MKKIKLAALVFAAGFLAGGCGASSGRGFQPAENSIYVSADGNISTATIESVQGEQYKEEDLLAFAEQQVSLFNEEMGSSAKSRNEEGQEKLPVAVQSCTIKDGRAEMILDYADARYVTGFSEESGILVKSLTVEPVSGDLPALKKPDGSSADTGEAAKSGGMIIRTEGAVTIQTEGTIRYITDGVTVVDERTVRTPEHSGAVIFK